QQETRRHCKPGPNGERTPRARRRDHRLRIGDKLLNGFIEFRHSINRLRKVLYPRCAATLTAETLIFICAATSPMLLSSLYIRSSISRCFGGKDIRALFISSPDSSFWVRSSHKIFFISSISIFSKPPRL